MKKIKYLIIAFGIISVFLVGCSNVNEEKYIEVHNRIDEENKYAYFNKIVDNEKVQTVESILNDLDWENRKADMNTPANYKFIIGFKDSRVKAVPLSYSLWISPNKETVEIVMDNESKYARLNTTDSAEIFKILVGEELANMKN